MSNSKDEITTKTLLKLRYLSFQDHVRFIFRIDCITDGDRRQCANHHHRTQHLLSAHPNGGNIIANERRFLKFEEYVHFTEEV